MLKNLIKITTTNLLNHHSSYYNHMQVVVAMDMSSHLDRTSHKPRDPNIIHHVKVKQIFDLSPTVKQIVLSIPTTTTTTPLTFQAGQWVDLFVDGIDKIGGFTITSSPSHLMSNGTIHLAIKYSNEQPALWIHTQCDVNSEVSIRFGGDFVWNQNTQHCGTYFLFLAGGVGINPLISMIREITATSPSSPSQSSISFALLYSAKSPQELIFKKELEIISKTHPNFNLKFFITNPNLPKDSLHNGHNFFQRRIQKDDLEQLLNAQLLNGQVPNVKVYICGPPPMISDFEIICKELNLSNISYEKWW